MTSDAMQRSMESLSTWDCNQGSLNTIVVMVRVQGVRVLRRKDITSVLQGEE